MEFFGFYQVDSTQSSVLNRVIHDILRRLNVSIKFMINKVIRRRCYDGAAAQGQELPHKYRRKSQGQCLLTVMATP